MSCGAVTFVLRSALGESGIKGMAGQILARDRLLAEGRKRLLAGASTAVLALTALATVLTVALALGTAPAWADGGNGAPVGAGQGGVDGALAGATGQNAANGATAGGGGGGVDLTTGNGAPGGWEGQVRHSTPQTAFQARPVARARSFPPVGPSPPA